jgi:hypothetical protein
LLQRPVTVSTVTRLLTLLIALGYALSPLAAAIHVEEQGECCNAPGLYCDDCDTPGHHHHHDATKCGTCSQTGVASIPNVRTTQEPPRPIAAEIRPADSARPTLDVLLPASRAPPAARV